MTASPDDTLDELRSIAVLLAERVGADPAARVEPGLLDRVERAVALAVAWLAPTREAAAPAIEAAVAGSSPRHGALPLAGDLAITVDLLGRGLSAVHGLD